MIDLPHELVERIDAFASLSRWERREAGRALRSLGLSYGEIRRHIDVPKGTLAGWCRDIELTDEQCREIVERTGSRKGVPNDTQRKRRAEIESIRTDAEAQVAGLLGDPLWTAGTVLYWGEGSKTGRRLSLTNSDDAALRLFIEWSRRFHDAQAAFVLALHLHHGNDETYARDFWRAALELPGVDFTKSFIKPAGTGHRKNVLHHGVCRVTMRKSSDALERTMSWISELASILAPGGPCGGAANLSVGR